GAKRVRELVDKLGDLAKEQGIVIVRCSRDEVLKVFGQMGANSKDDIAAVIARIVPELAPRVPPRRRIWESEHHSMGIFEAAALALTQFARTKGVIEGWGTG